MRQILLVALICLTYLPTFAQAENFFTRLIQKFKDGKNKGIEIEIEEVEIPEVEETVTESVFSIQEFYTLLAAVCFAYGFKYYYSK